MESTRWGVGGWGFTGVPEPSLDFMCKVGFVAYVQML